MHLGACSQPQPQPPPAEKRNLEQLATALEVPVNVAKQMAYKRRALLGMDSSELKAKVRSK